MSEESLRKELVASFKNRAMIYHGFFVELREEVGEEKAAEIMARAIYKRGLAAAQRFTQYGPHDMEGIKDAFLGFLPDQGALFGPELERCDGDGVDIKLHRCPLKEAWLEEGIDEKDVARLCKIAATVDNGTFEGAGFKFHAETWEPGREGCCHLHIRPGDR